MIVCVGRTRLFHTVVIVGAGLLANCGKHASPPAAGSAAKPADAASPADSAVDAETPADAAVDATPVDAGTSDAAPRPKKKFALPKPSNHVRIMIKPPPEPTRIMKKP